MQVSLFDGSKRFKIDKPIRLIELFGGYGSQHFALEYLGLEFEQWKLCEWAVKSIQAYKDAHFKDDNIDYSKDLSKEQIFEYLANKGISSNYNEPMTYEQIKRMGECKARIVYNNIMATHNLVNIQQTKGVDFNIVDTDKYCYIMTYSFPCQDLSSAGLGKGMEKGSGTRSGMLWEVERILDELKQDNKELPQVLVMENVPQVHGTKNRQDFETWIEKLKEFGYSNFWQDLNSKDFGVPQNRKRTFMVSILGDYIFEFPKSKELEIRMRDLLQDEVDEKYYLSDSMKQYIVSEDDKYIVSQSNLLVHRDIAVTINTRVGQTRADCSDYICGNLPQNYNLKNIPTVLGGIGEKKPNNGTQWYQQDRIYDDNVALCVATTFNPFYAIKSNNKRLYSLVDKIDLSQDNQFLDIYNQTTSENAGTITTRVDASNSTAVYTDYRIRKLTPKECFRLMGVKDQDFEKIEVNQSNASLYHLAGDSIVVDVLMAIFKEMF